MKQLSHFQEQNLVRKSILRYMKDLLRQSGYRLTGDNEKDNPILSLFDPVSVRILGGFETRWMSDDILKGFLTEENKLPDYEAVLIRALPGTKSSMHIHERGCSIITCLGNSYGFPEPVTELMYGYFVPQRRRQRVRRIPLTDNGFTFITPYVVHAFHTPAGGTSYALALATPRIKEDQDKFDFVILKDGQWEEVKK